MQSSFAYMVGSEVGSQERFSEERVPGKMLLFLKKQGMGFVIRVTRNVEVEEGKWIPLRELLTAPSERDKVFQRARHQAEHTGNCRPGLVLSEWRGVRSQDLALSYRCVISV